MRSKFGKERQKMDDETKKRGLHIRERKKADGYEATNTNELDHAEQPLIVCIQGTSSAQVCSNNNK